MEYELICTWLGLPNAVWPPDHYTLLGLPPGEASGERIEQHAHERLARVRCYQISHPAPATEAMNRIAQAVVCLTDRQAKRAYDAAHFPHLPIAEPPPPPKTAPAPAAAPTAVLAPAAPPQVAAAADTAVVAPVQTQVDWKDATPPPVRFVVPAVSDPTPLPPRTTAPALPAPTPAAGTPATPAPRPAGPATSPEARRGLYTRRAIHARVQLTRRLLRAWERVGKYAGKPRRKLMRPAEETELARLLGRLDELLQQFPPVLGQPGQPGYRLLVLAHDDNPVAVFKGLDPEAREALARDWVAGLGVLSDHRDFLRHQIKALRRHGRGARLARSLAAVLNEHPVWLGAALLLVIGIALTVVLLS